jgi:hypothetical protein
VTGTRAGPRIPDYSQRRIESPWATERSSKML